MLRASAASIQLTSIYDAVHTRSSSSSSSSSASDNAQRVPAELLPYAHMLVIDGVHVLLDCGWDTHFDVAYLQALLPYVRRADAVLLSTAELRSCGALPFVLEHLRPDAFVAAAGATSRFGLHTLLHTFMYQYPNTHTFALSSSTSTMTTTRATTVQQQPQPLSFTLTIDKIYSAFRSVREPYGGVVTVTRDGVELTCQALFAGRMLGGYAWLVRCQIDEILYCADCALRPSYVMKRQALPTSANIVLLPGYAVTRRSSGGDGGVDVSRITVSNNNNNNNSSSMVSGNSGNKRQHEEQLQALLRHVQNTLRAGSDVLVPVDVAARGIEVLSLLHHLLHERGGGKYTLVCAAVQAPEVIAKALTTTEALQSRVLLSERSWLAGVVACRTAHEAAAVASPKLIVADGVTLDYGLAAELLELLLSRNDAMHNNNNGSSSSRSNTAASSPLHGAEAAALLLQQHLVVLVEPLLPHSNAARLAAAAQAELLDRQAAYEGRTHQHHHHNDNSSSNNADDDDVLFEFAYTQRERLSTEELEQYYLQLEHAAEATRRRLAEAEAARIVADDADDVHHDDDDEDDEDVDTGAAHGMAAAALIATVDRDPTAHEAASAAAAAVATGAAATSSSSGTRRPTPRAHAHLSAADASGDDDGDHDKHAAATAAATTRTRTTTTTTTATTTTDVRRAGNTPGLTLPSYMYLHSKHLHFPVLERTQTLQAALLRGDDVAYGLPVSDEEQSVLRTRAPVRVHSDAGPEAAARLHNDAQREANEPAKTHTRVCVCHRRSCRVLYCDLSGLPETTALRALLRGHFCYAKKIVVLRSGGSASAEVQQAVVRLCRDEQPPLPCAEQVLMLPPPPPLSSSSPSSSSSVAASPSPAVLELATPVYSYMAQLEPALSHTLPRLLHHVRATMNSSGGGWQVAWLDAQLHVRHGGAAAATPPLPSLSATTRTTAHEDDGEDDGQQTRKRPRSDKDDDDSNDDDKQDGRHDDDVLQRRDALLMLAPVRGAAARQRCAEARAAQRLRRGAVFVGDVDLARVRDAACRDDGLRGECHAKAPMLVFDDAAAALRRSSDGTVTLAAMATPAMYELRQCVYRQYDHVL